MTGHRFGMRGKLIDQVCGLEYEVSGQGEAVLLIHGAILRHVRALGARGVAGRLPVHPVPPAGYGQSELGTGEPTIEGHALDALSLLDALGERRAHVVAHSGGGPIAVQMAVSAPEVARSLVLLEPALQNAAMAAAFDELLAPLVERYDSGERAKAVHVFMRTATNPDWRNQTEERLPGAVARAEDDAAATFHGDLPALRQWDFDTVRGQITQPSLLMVGAISERLVRRVSAMFRDAVPASEYAVIEGADHSMATTRPEAVAPVVAEFLNRHPLT